MSELPLLHRPAFFDGQALAAADLTAVQDYHRDLLWLHQRTLHGSGIVSGLATSGSKGDKAVLVRPGYAVDVSGRSIVLGADVTVPIPAVVGGPTGGPVDYYLTISYVEDDDVAAVIRGGACATSGAVRRGDDPALTWRGATEIRSDTDIVLGAISVQGCKLTAGVDPALRRHAIPEHQPFVYAGQTALNGRKWAAWKLEDGSAVGVRLAVGTGEAGFVNTPRYQVEVVGSRDFSDRDGRRGLLDGYAQVLSASSDGFEVRIALPPRGELVNPGWLLEDDTLPTRIDAQWYVSWVGVEG